MTKKGNPEALKKSAAKRKSETEKRIYAAIQRIVSKQTVNVSKWARITPASIAREAEVGRDTIYRYPEALAYIQRLRDKKSTSFKSGDKPGSSNADESYKNLQQINKQLALDKLNLARENNRLQSENDEFKERFQIFQQEIDRLRTKLAEKKIVSIRR